MNEERGKKRQQGVRVRKAARRDDARRKLLGANMRAARLQLGFTQEHVAGLLGISTEVYGRMERGSIFPRLGRFIDLCEKLCVPPSRLLGYPAPELPVAGAARQEEWSTGLHRFMPVTQRLTQPQLLFLRRYLVDLNRMLTAFLEQEHEQGLRPSNEPTS